jgi:hypothetical protein
VLLLSPALTEPVFPPVDVRTREPLVSLLDASGSPYFWPSAFLDESTISRLELTADVMGDGEVVLVGVGAKVAGTTLTFPSYE